MIQGENSAEFNTVLRDIPKISLLHVMKDAHIRRAFAAFNETQVSSRTFLTVAILITLCAVVFLFRFRAFLLDPYTESEFVAAIILASIQVFLIVILWIIWYLKVHSGDPNRCWVVKIIYKTQPALQVILPIGISVFYGLQLLMRVSGGQCEKDKLYLNMLMCNPNHDTNGLPEETLAQLMLMPIVFHIILRDSLIGTFYVSYLVSFASITVAAFMLNIKQITPFLAIYFFFSTVIHYDNQRQNLSLFFLAEKLKYSLSENERLAAETHATELRHMIANVAHDLKTPLTSFLSGVEFITQIVMDWDERLSDPAKSLSTVENVEFASESLTAIHGCLESIRNTNSFMIMTINRCIDFTKASKGLKLVPKLETIDLQETVDLPIKVMRDFKSHLAINMLPISPEICTHLISDRQWLQENLLCLMSNAVKYSSKGTVEISVALVTLPIIKPVAEVVQVKPSTRRKKNSLNKGNNKVIPDNLSENTRATLASASADAHSPTNAQINANDPHSNNNSTKLGNISTHSSYSLTGGSENPESFKVRKLSNFVFNHDYNTMGRSRIFSEKMLADINREEEEQNDAIEEEGEDEEEEGEEGLFLKIEVQDTGIGLSKEAMATLFTPFKQAQRLAGGTGLGLYSLAKRIEALCGHYGVSNRRDRTPGSLFWFAIPYRPDNVFAQSMAKQNKARSNSMRTMNHAAHAARIAAMRVNSENTLIDLENPPLAMMGSQSRSNNSLPSEPSLPSVAPSSSGRPSSALSASSKHEMMMMTSPGGRPPSLDKLSILLVDDSLSILKMTTMMLKRSGHKVEQADNGAEGLDMILRGYERMSALGMVRGRCDTPYDVVLMDLQMPVMDGLESVRRLRAAERELTQAVISTVEGDFSGDGYDAKDDSIVRDYVPLPKPPTASSKLLSASNLSDLDSRKTVDSNHSGARAGHPATRQRRQFVIGVSANSDHGTMLEAMKAGFDAFIGKPFSIDSFYEVLQSHQTKEKERK